LDHLLLPHAGGGYNSNSAAPELLDNARLPVSHPGGYRVPLWGKDMP
jgi:hypothetical protein